MRAQRTVAFVVGPLAVQVQLERREQRRESIWIIELVAAGSEPIRLRLDRGHEESRIVDTLHRDAAPIEEDRCFKSVREPRANFVFVRTEHCKRIAMTSLDDRL